MQHVSQTASQGNEADLAARMVALAGSRLCHDLISPVGAIGNGVELLQMAGGAVAESPEMALIEDALKSARARIRIFRTAFGAAGGSQRVSHPELSAMLGDVQDSGRLSVALDASGDHSRAVIKLVILSLMCLETAMPWGAKVALRQNGPGWVIDAQADRTRQDRDLWGWLSDPTGDRPDPSASDIHFAILGLSARQAGRKITWTLDDTTAQISF